MAEKYETPVLQKIGEHYAGPMVGGSMAGSRLASGSRVYECPVVKDLGDMFGDQSAHVSVEREIYVFTQIMYPDGDDVATLSFWRINTLPDAKAALEHVFAGYVENAKAKKK